MPRVSVIVPAHNASLFIEKAIDSVRKQTYDDWELIVVDDGSSDGTWELLQAAGPRVRSLRREHAGGPAVARNLALQNATGEFVAFLDADDLFLPRYLESQLDYYKATVGRCQGRLGIVACDARIMIDNKCVPYTYMQRIPNRHGPITLERVLLRNPIYISCLVPTAVGEQVGWFDPELFGTEDFGLWIKILEVGFSAVLNPEVLAVYRRTIGAVSSNIVRQGANNRRVYRLALKRGHLTARQRRIVRAAIRYNRAMEYVALLRFGDDRRWRSVLRRPRRLALLAWVALVNPRMWRGWFELLLSGRSEDAVELRAHP